MADSPSGPSGAHRGADLDRRTVGGEAAAEARGAPVLDEEEDEDAADEPEPPLPGLGSPAGGAQAVAAVPSGAASAAAKAEASTPHRQGRALSAEKGSSAAAEDDVVSDSSDGESIQSVPPRAESSKAAVMEQSPPAPDAEPMSPERKTPTLGAGGRETGTSCASGLSGSALQSASTPAGKTTLPGCVASPALPVAGCSLAEPAVAPEAATVDVAPAKPAATSVTDGAPATTAVPQKAAVSVEVGPVLVTATATVRPEASDTNGIWPQAELPSVKPGEGQALRVFCGVWNLHGKQAPADITPWLPTYPSHHVYVVGTCECERSIERSLLWGDKARWEQQVQDHLGEDFRKVGSQNMSAIHIMVFMHRSIWKYCHDIKTGQVATGFCNFVGNKGGTQVGFTIGRTSMLFCNAHLTAHQGKMKERTQNLSRILVDSPLRRSTAGTGVHEDYDRVFFMGDLNPRVDARRNEVDTWLEKGQLDQCLARDQLLPLLHANPGEARPDGPAGMWPVFEEGSIGFPPTYKFDAHTERYDSSKKQRIPSWTDRILWKRDPGIRFVKYDSVPSMQCSDHRPIFGCFEVSVDLDEWTGPLPSAVSRRDRSSVCSMQ